MFVLILDMYRWQLKVEKTAEMFGRTLPFMITLLFIPVTRGSPILRLIDVPFEACGAVPEMVGQLTMILTTAHAAIYCMYYGSKQQIHLVCFKLRLQSACIPTLIKTCQCSFRNACKMIRRCRSLQRWKLILVITEFPEFMISSQNHPCMWREKRHLILSFEYVWTDLPTSEGQLTLLKSSNPKDSSVGYNHFDD